MINRDELLNNYIQMCEQIKCDKSRTKKERAEYYHLYKWLTKYKYLKEEKESKYGITKYTLHLDDIVVESENEKVMKKLAKYFKEKDDYNIITLSCFTNNGNTCGGYIETIKDDNKCNKNIGKENEARHKDVNINELKEELLKTYDFERTIAWI